MLALVTGGGGRLGNVLVRRLLDSGQQVRVLEPGNRPESLEGLEIDFVSGSVLDVHDIARALEGVDVVYHLAAKIALRPKKDPLMMPINRVGWSGMGRAKRKAVGNQELLPWKASWPVPSGFMVILRREK